MRVLLTGATGFLGSSLLVKLASSTQISHVRALTRRQLKTAASGTLEWISCPDFFLIDSSDSAVLQGVQVVIHAAGRAHVMDETAVDPLAEFRRVNLEGTLSLARRAADAGVRRFIFVSSIKVNGEGTSFGKPYTADDVPAPSDPYGVSKQEAEDGLRRLAAETGMEVVIIRPPLVYGPGVKANFLAMMRWLHLGVPLPLGAIRNQRSLVALDNLIDLIVTCIAHPAAANQTFLAADGEDLSTTDLLRRLGAALGRPARLLPVPMWLLKAGATMIGKSALSHRLCGSLQVDISKNRQMLGWVPPVKVDEALRLTAEHYVRNR